MALIHTYQSVKSDFATLPSTSMLATTGSAADARRTAVVSSMDTYDAHLSLVRLDQPASHVVARNRIPRERR